MSCQDHGPNQQCRFCDTLSPPDLRAELLEWFTGPGGLGWSPGTPTLETRIDQLVAIFERNRVSVDPSQCRVDTNSAETPRCSWCRDTGKLSDALGPCFYCQTIEQVRAKTPPTPWPGASPNKRNDDG